MPIKGDKKQYLQVNKYGRIVFSVGNGGTMKRQAEMVEGPEAWKRFESVMKGVLAVPHSKVQRQVKEHRREAASNSKRKTKPTASPDA